MNVKAYDGFIDSIVGRDPDGLIDFEPPMDSKERAWELAGVIKERSLTEEEAAELQHYRELEHILRMAKARARLRKQQNFATALNAGVSASEPVKP